MCYIFNFSSSCGYTAPLVSFCIFQMLSIFHVHIYIYYLMKYMFKYFSQYSNRLLLLLTCASSVGILDKIPFCDTCFAIIFFWSVACLFFLYIIFKDYKFLILMKSNLPFFYNLCLFVILLKISFKLKTLNFSYVFPNNFYIQFLFLVL